MKTPTQEEVKDRVAVKHGFLHWNDLSYNYFFRFGTCNDTSIRDVFLEIENEAMRDYAEAYHKAEVGKARESLPTYLTYREKRFYEDGKNYEGTPNESFEWMKEQASVVIAKVKHNRDLSIALANAHWDRVLEFTERLEQKDKEIKTLISEFICSFKKAEQGENKSFEEYISSELIDLIEKHKQ